MIEYPVKCPDPFFINPARPFIHEKLFHFNSQGTDLPAELLHDVTAKVSALEADVLTHIQWPA